MQRWTQPLGLSTQASPFYLSHPSYSSSLGALFSITREWVQESSICCMKSFHLSTLATLCDQNHSPSRLIVGVKGPRNFLPLTSALLLLLRVTSREASSPASFSRTRTEWYIYCTQGFFIKKPHTFPFPDFRREDGRGVVGRGKGKKKLVRWGGKRRKLKSSFSFLLLPPSPPPSPPSFLLPLF